MRKQKSLNRFIAICTMIIFAVAVVILVMINIFSINNYQKMNRTERMSQLSGYADSCVNNLVDIATMINDIQANNNNFTVLTRNVGNLPNVWDYVYELDYVLRRNMAFRENLAGYVFTYQHGEHVYYYSDQERVPVEDIKFIKNMVTEYSVGENSALGWQYMMVNEQTYGLYIRPRGQASICGIFCFEPVKDRILESIDRVENVFFLRNQSVLGSEEQKEKYQELPAMAETYAQAFQMQYAGEYVYGMKLGSGHMWICMSEPLDFFSYINIPQLLLLGVTIFCIVMIFFMYRFLKREVLTPLQEVTEVMNRVRDGEWDVHMEEKARFEEIEKVNEALTVMVAEIKKQKMLSYEQTIEKQKAQMQYLHLQLKPHFYLNGLKTLNVFAKNGENANMEDLIMRLSVHLRYLLQVEREVVNLADEVNYVKNYVQLQKDMTGRPFSVVFDVPDGLDAWTVPTLCIQTFVENSFKYAKLGSASEELMIRVIVCELDTEEGMYLDIQVCDNGAGYPWEVLQEINETPTEGSRMVGINNIKRRCNFIYGSDAQFCFYNEEGACSEMILPKRQKKETAQ